MQLRPVSSHARDESGFNPHALIEKLTSSNVELERFAHLCSHDLKEPLRGMGFLAQTLIEDYAGVLPHEAQTRLARIKTLSCKLQKRIADLLHYACISHEELAMEDVEASALVADAVEELFDTLAQNHAQVTVEGSLPKITCHRALTLSVFLHLIANAVKYNSRAQKQVTISCAPACEHEGRTWKNVFCVADNGIGVDARYHAEMFTVFKRVHSPKAYGEGAGVGLTFARCIVERHGGCMWVRSAPGEGSCFYFTLEPANG